jgi:hypothetical protein
VATIHRIDVWIQTGNREGAGTNGKVSLGILGREFLLDNRGLQGADFEPGPSQQFTLGEGATVLDPEENDPRAHPRLDTDSLGTCSVWIRFEPENNLDNWNVESAQVYVRSTSGQVYEYSRERGHAWLGPKSGRTWFNVPKRS